MIARYTRPALGSLWTDEARMQAWRKVELAACEELPSLLGDSGPSEAELEAIRAASFTVEAVQERERLTEHDLAAFVDVLAASAGEAGRWIHYGLTSSDVLDTALALQLRAAGDEVLAGARALVAAFAQRAREHAGTLTVGRTHGIHAEPTSFGLKLAGFAFEANRNAVRLERAFAQAAVGALSGAVGTYAATSPEFEARVLGRLGLQREDVSTQVVARDRHAEYLWACAAVGATVEQLATEIRHLQRTEVGEVAEPFRAGQKGSSAMPHKRNPILSERLAGLARVLRGNLSAGLEDVALWHERDISHSSVERVILPDSSLLAYYLLVKMRGIVEGMQVHPERMLENDYLQHQTIGLVQGMSLNEKQMLANLELTHGALFSQRVLLALVEAGSSRDDAYRLVQELAQRAWDGGIPLRDLLAADERARGLDLDDIFDYSHYLQHAGEILARLDEIA